jgi:Skp family chaperone for outer membrane proteins
LLAIVVHIPFIVSFGALQDLAAENGVNYPFMFPLMIDLSLIIFNLIALRSSLYGERNRYAWALVVVATTISVLLNVVHASRTPLAMFMASLPPLFILAAFHLVVMCVEQSARRNGVVMTLAKLDQLIAQTRTEHEQLTVQKDTIQDEIGQHHEQLTAVQAELAAAQRELAQLKREQSKALNDQSKQPSLDDEIEARRERLQALLNDPSAQMTQAEMAEKLGVSLSTVRRDLNSLNGQVA